MKNEIFIYQKNALAFYLVAIGVLIYPLYFSSWGVEHIDRVLIDTFYAILGTLIFLLTQKTVRLLALSVLFIIIFMEYTLSPALIHNYSPDSTVAPISGKSGNVGILLYTLMSTGYIFCARKQNGSFKINWRFLTSLFTLCFFLYLALSLFSYSRNYGALLASNAVNGHSYYLTGLAIFIYLFSSFENKKYSLIVKAVVLAKIIASIFIFKTRGVIILDIVLLISSFKIMHASSALVINKLKLKIAVILACYLLIYIIIFYSKNVAGYFSEIIPLPMFSKESSGLRDVAIVEWYIYIKSAYQAGVEPIVPSFTPHSTYLGLLGYFGVAYFLFFSVITITIILSSRKNKNLGVDKILLLSGIGVLLAVAFISPASNVYYLIIIALILNFDQFKKLRKAKSDFHTIS